MTAPTTAKRTGASTLMRFFGKRPGQTTQDFAAEIKSLPDEDFADLVSQIKQIEG